MLNLYDEIRIKEHYIKFEAGNLLFTEYTCPIEEKSLGIWTHTDYIVHVVSGKKAWHIADEDWTAEAGQTIFFRKGAAIVEQFFDEDFCLLLFFIPDEFIRGIVNELSPEINRAQSASALNKPAIRVNNDATLNMYFKTMLTYFANLEKPSESLLRLKLKELILSILVSSNNPELKDYFRSFLKNKKPLLTEIMENNFRYNLTLENFAELSHRSLSSFKRDFQKQFNQSPGRWLLNKRLEYATTLLRNRDMSISQIIFESGFENISHFNRVFKNKYGVAPGKFTSLSTAQ